MEKSSFFNSINGDRKYKASDFAEYFNSFITNGIFPNPSTNLQVVANNNMTITVKKGKAWINGYIYVNTDDLTLNVDIADGVLKRIDKVVIQYNTVNREIKAKVKKGTFASNTVAPILQRDADIWELGIADILVNNGSISITQANITDLRLNNSYCGIVNSIIQADTTTIFNQYMAWYTQTTGQAETDIINLKKQFESDFNTWFTTVQGTLSGDVAGNLLNLINETVNKIGILNTNFESHKSDNVYQTAGGTGTAITLTIKGSLITGYPINFIASENNNGITTTINAKPLYKPGTNTSPTLKVGRAYTAVYNSTGDCFFIKASATGTVTSDKVLAGETFSTEEDTDLVGTMINNSGAGIVITPGISDQAVNKGYTDGTLGSITVKGEPNLISANLVTGKTYFGISGSAIPAVLTPGENLWFSSTSNNADASHSSSAYTKKKEIQILTKGTVRVKFDLRSGGGGPIAYGQIYVNGNPVGIERSTSSTVATTYSEDIAVNTNDYIQIYTRISVNTATTVIVNNFKLYTGNKIPSLYSVT